MMATEINWIRFVALFLYVDHYFNNNDNHKITYLSSSMPQRDKVIYASVVNGNLSGYLSTSWILLNKGQPATEF